MVQNLLARANAALDKGDPDTAINLISSYLKEQPAEIDALYLLGVAYQEARNFGEAQRAFARVLAIQAQHFGAQYGMALVLLNQGRHREALAHHDAAARLAPQNFWVYINRGVSKAALGQYGEAIADYDRALGLHPQLPAAWANKGNALSELGQLDAALACHEKVIAVARHDPNAWSNLGLALNGLKRHADAEHACRKALALAPGFAVAWRNLGHALYELERFADAEAACRKVIELEPHSASAWSNLGAALAARKHYEAAETACRNALERDAQSPEAWRNLGIALGGQKRYEAAVTTIRRAVELAPRSPVAWNNLGIALGNLKQLEAAEAAYRKALELAPESPGLWASLGNALDRSKQTGAAAECYAKCLELDPQAQYVLAGLLHTRMKLCDWRDFEENLARLLREIELGKFAFHPFPVLALTDDPAVQKTAAESYAREKYPPNPALGKIPPRGEGKRIRIAYFSADFRNHPLSYLMAGVFECHDKERFELFAFSFCTHAPDETTRRVAAAFDRFIDVGKLSDEEVVHLSRELGIDIAIDLTGYTEDNRAGLFACRAAPIQVAYLGFPGTSGAAYIDYLIADETLIPQASQQHYSEKVIYLPHTYWPNDAKLPIPGKRFSRQDLGLPAGGFVFCCFNNNYKITPTTFASWMNILKQVEGALLWLFEDNPAAGANLRREAQLHGVAPERLHFAQRMAHADHLARIPLVDLVLDTLPYNAGTTASDALWLGVPVLTLRGESYVGRIAASQLNAIGLAELITTSREEYERLAIRLATHPETLGAIKTKLARNRLTTPLFDTAGHTRRLEAAYTAVFDRYRRGLAADHVYLESVMS